MTEQESEVWVERLPRIWEPTRLLSRYDPAQENSLFLAHLQIGCILEVNTRLSFVLLLFDGDDAETEPTSWAEPQYHQGSVSINAQGVLRRRAWSKKWDEEQFTTQWLPLFRRGCWLSGCRIEATAHEKAEWMQGFTREEVEAWNLTF